jgi:hypothetical protein
MGNRPTSSSGTGEGGGAIPLRVVRAAGAEEGRLGPE